MLQEELQQCQTEVDDFRAKLGFPHAPAEAAHRIDLDFSRTMCGKLYGCDAVVSPTYSVHVAQVAESRTKLQAVTDNVQELQLHCPNLQGYHCGNAFKCQRLTSHDVIGSRAREPMSSCPASPAPLPMLGPLACAPPVKAVDPG